MARQDIDREIYELGEIERDANRLTQFSRPGSLFHRLFSWVERGVRRLREDARAERDEMREAERVCETCEGEGMIDHSAGGVGPAAYTKFECPDCGGTGVQ